MISLQWTFHWCILSLSNLFLMSVSTLLWVTNVKRDTPSFTDMMSDIVKWMDFWMEFNPSVKVFFPKYNPATNTSKIRNYHINCISEILCGMPDIPDDVHIESLNITIGGRMTFRCDPGYALSHTKPIYCTEFGLWFGQVPSCIGMSTFVKSQLNSLGVNSSLL